MRTTSLTGQRFIGKQEWRPFDARCGWDAARGLYFRYKDYKGFWTFGIGHLEVAGDDFSAGRTFDEVEVLFAHDLAKYEKPVQLVDELLVLHRQPPLEQNEFDALVDFAFNEGTHSLTPEGNSAVRALLEGRRADVPRLLLPWDVTGGVHDPGLHRRRESEGYVFTHPYPTEPTELDRYFVEVRAILAKAPMFDLTAGAFSPAHAGELHEDDDGPPTRNERQTIEPAPPTERNS